MTSFSVALFEETPLMLLEELFSGIGGIFGLWLGLSLIPFSHLVIFTIKWVLKRKQPPDHSPDALGTTSIRQAILSKLVQPNFRQNFIFSTRGWGMNIRVDSNLPCSHLCIVPLLRLKKLWYVSAQNSVKPWLQPNGKKLAKSLQYYRVPNPYFPMFDKAYSDRLTDLAEILQVCRIWLVQLRVFRVIVFFVLSLLRNCTRNLLEGWKTGINKLTSYTKKEKSGMNGWSQYFLSKNKNWNVIGNVPFNVYFNCGGEQRY